MCVGGGGISDGALCADNTSILLFTLSLAWYHRFEKSSFAKEKSFGRKEIEGAFAFKR